MVGKLKDMFGGDFQAPIAKFPDFEHLEARGRNPKGRTESGRRRELLRGRSVMALHGKL